MLLLGAEIVPSPSLHNKLPPHSYPILRDTGQDLPSLFPGLQCGRAGKQAVAVSLLGHIPALCLELTLRMGTVLTLGGMGTRVVSREGQSSSRLWTLAWPWGARAGDRAAGSTEQSRKV